MPKSPSKARQISNFQNSLGKDSESVLFFVEGHLFPEQLPTFSWNTFLKNVDTGDSYIRILTPSSTQWSLILTRRHWFFSNLKDFNQCIQWVGDWDQVILSLISKNPTLVSRFMLGLMLLLCWVEFWYTLLDLGTSSWFDDGLDNTLLQWFLLKIRSVRMLVFDSMFWVIGLAVLSCLGRR